MCTVMSTSRISKNDGDGIPNNSHLKQGKAEEDNPGSVQTAMLSSNGVGSPGFFAPEVILMRKYCGYKAGGYSYI
mgnify:CR=1 FL=1